MFEVLPWKKTLVNTVDPTIKDLFVVEVSD